MSGSTLEEENFKQKFINVINNISSSIFDQNATYHMPDIESFLYKPDCRVLYITCTEEGPTLIQRNDKRVLESKQCLVAIIKPNQILEFTSNFFSQLVILSVPNVQDALSELGTDNLKAILEYGVEAYLDLLSSNGNMKNLSNKDMNIIKKRIKKLTIDLGNVHQTIPILISSIPPVVQLWLNENSQKIQQGTLQHTDDDLLDANFLRSIQTLVHGWVQSVEEVIKLDNDPSDGSLSDEISFWMAKQESLLSIKSQLENPEICAVLDFLKAKKKSHSFLQLLSSSVLTEALKTASEHTDFFRGLHIEDIQGARTFEELKASCDSTFSGFKKIKQIRYPANKSFEILKLIVQEFEKKLKSLISSNDLFFINEKEFSELVANVHTFIEFLDTDLRICSNSIRELLRKDNNIFVSLKIVLPRYLLDILHEIDQIRTYHTKFQKNLQTIAEKTDTLFHQQIIVCNELILEEQKCYSAFTSTSMSEILDNSNTLLKQGRQLYLQQNSLLEKRLASVIRDILSDASKEPDTLFEMFDNLQFLLNQPQIKLLTNEYNSILLQSIETELLCLENQFKRQSELSSLINQLNIPYFTSKIVWSKQVLHTISRIFCRLEIVLTKDWANYPQGKRFAAKISSLISEIDIDEALQIWASQSLEKFQSRCPVIFTKQNKNSTIPDGSKKVLTQLKVNSKELEIIDDTSLLPVFKLKVPKEMESISSKLQIIQSYALHTQETIAVINKCQNFNAALEHFASNSKILTRFFSKQAQTAMETLIQECPKIEMQIITGQQLTKMSLESEKLSFILKYRLFAYNWIQKFVLLTKFIELILQGLQSLEFTEYNFSSIAKQIGDIQSYLLEIESLKFDTIDQFTLQLNMEIESVLSRKLELEFKAFQSLWTSGKVTAISKIHTLDINDGQLILDNPIEDSKLFFFDQLANIVQVVTSQNWISLSPWEKSFQKFSIKRGKGEIDYQKTLKMVLASFNEFELFLKEWRSILNLWKFDYTLFEQSKNDDLRSWLFLLEKVQSMKETLDNTFTSKYFGQLGLCLNNGRRDLLDQFNLCQKKVLAYFSKVLLGHIETNSEKITKFTDALNFSQKTALNAITIIEMVSALQESKDYLMVNEATIKNIHTGSVALMRTTNDSKFQLKDYQSFAQKVNNLTHFVNHTMEYAESNLSAILTAVSDEVTRLTHVTANLRKKWQKQKPVNDTSLQQISFILKNYDSAFSELATDISNVKRALRFTGGDCSLNVDIEIQEIATLKALWEQVAELSIQLEKLENIEWGDVSTGQLREKLENLLISSRSLPADCFELKLCDAIQSQISNWIKSIPMISSLQDCALDVSHWSQIFRQIKAQECPQNLKLGKILSLDLVSNSTYLKSIIAKADAEKQIEQSLNLIENSWQNENFKVLSINSGVPLITGWAYLIDKNKDDISIIDAMKSSPHFKKFNTRVVNLEKKLVRMFSIIELWCEIQKEWTYLNSIILESPYFEKTIPIDFNRFKNLTHDLKRFVNTAISGINILVVLEIPDVIVTLKRISDTLIGVKRALYGYLEQQREIFPRFYFIGNEDMLEMIGNSTKIQVIEKHIRKIFPAIMSFEIDDSSKIVSIISPENEVLVFVNPLPIPANNSLVSFFSDLEFSIKETLLKNLLDCVDLFTSGNLEDSSDAWITSNLMFYPNQTLILGLQIWATNLIESSAKENQLSRSIVVFETISENFTKFLKITQNSLHRTKVENLLIELMHKVSVSKELLQLKLDLTSFVWYKELKFYFKNGINGIENVQIMIGSYTTSYSFEYLGSPKKLAYTSSLGSAYLLLSEALRQNLGGLLMGPAGTGKTESVKSLGYHFGRLTFVFCCDDSFDLEAVTRILTGITSVGAWGCFDEFNRLERNILSSISTQLEMIQSDTSAKSSSGNNGLFITNNPRYDGRTALPDNLKSKFLSYYLMKPDFETIGETLLTIEGFSRCSELVEIITLFFNELRGLCSKQAHYDFTLRTFKSVISYAGKIFRNNQTSTSFCDEKEVILSSLSDVVLPRLVKADQEIFWQKVNEIDASFTGNGMNVAQREVFETVAKKNNLMPSESLLTKCYQLLKIEKMSSGVILLGSPGSGKSAALTVSFKTRTAIDKMKGETFRIDPKLLSKKSLFGTFDETTREWSDGIFTSILRKIDEEYHSNSNSYYWIVFDGDIDPNWVENLNSLLDDNKAFTLPNGERLILHQNTTIIFETCSLEFATPATISRCCTIYCDDSYGDTNFLLGFMMADSLKKNDISAFSIMGDTYNEIKERFVFCLSQTLDQKTLEGIWNLSQTFNTVLLLTHNMAIRNLSRWLSHALRKLLEYSDTCQDISSLNIELYCKKQCIFAIIWSFAGQFELENRRSFVQSLSSFKNLKPILEDEDYSKLLYSKVTLPECSFDNLDVINEEEEFHPHMILGSGVMVPTKDTSCYENLIHILLESHNPFILCGPPGSGKTMLLLSTVRRSVHYELISFNFSKDTKIDFLIKALEQRSQYKVAANDLILMPKLSETWIVLFCDELNLPDTDKYGTQTVILFLRQLITQNGFWHPKRKRWVVLKNVQFVGACNPTEMMGRKPLSRRFLEHCTVIMVDYPTLDSLKQIYNAYCRAILRGLPDLIPYSKALAEAMVEVYAIYDQRFRTTEIPHYTSSPRELTRWSKSLYVALRHKVKLDFTDLIKLWAHEGLRLFSDRLMFPDEKLFMTDCLIKVAQRFFPYRNTETLLKNALLFSDWLDYDYQCVDVERLRTFVKGKFDVFNEEDSESNIILHDEMLENLVRIDRVMKNDQGHLILVGPNGVGKSTLVKFVCWMNGISFVQLCVYNGFTLSEFENILRTLLIDATIKDKKICFLIDESTILDNSFIEIMNTLLANGEVPGLFEGNDSDQFYEMCLKATQAAGLILESEEELRKWFIEKTTENLHVVFTVGNLYNSNTYTFINSPALFNRCVVNWMGQWKEESLHTVTCKFTEMIAVDTSQFQVKHGVELGQLVVEVLISLYNRTKSFLKVEISIPHFLHFLQLFVEEFHKEQNSKQILHSHTINGLNQLKETSLRIRQLGKILQQKEILLKEEEVKAKLLLDKMITEQNEAERKQDMSVKMEELFKQQEKEIIARRQFVLNELAEVKELLYEAQQGVMNIKKAHLTELRAMHNPPEAIKLVLESVCTLLGYKVLSWKEVQQVIRKDDFIANIVAFDGKDSISSELIKSMEQNYMAHEKFNYEAAERASKACGPLFMWIKAQLRFSAIVVKVNPLRQELEMLEEQLQDTKTKLKAIHGMIQDLQHEVENYKLQYSETIKDKEILKMEMTAVKEKLNRSSILLSSLHLERDRWEKNIKEYELQNKTMVGDVILQSAFVAFLGALSPYEREGVFQLFKTTLEEYGILYNQKIGLNFLPGIISPEQRGAWFDMGVPHDEQFMGNMAILTALRNEKPVYVIDPANLFPKLLSKLFPGNELVVTSFLDPDFQKTLENCVRFGGKMLICDGEYYDPIIGCLIAGRFSNVGAGRKLVRLGNVEVDLSSDFRLFIMTKNSTADVPSFVISNVILLNYSFTFSSKKNEAVTIAIQAKQPQMEKTRILTLKKNSECLSKLSFLEKDMLGIITMSKDAICDNDELLLKLEKIKMETSELSKILKEQTEVGESYQSLKTALEPLGLFYAKSVAFIDALVASNKNYSFSSTYLSSVLKHVCFDFADQDTPTILLQFSLQLYKVLSISLKSEDREILKMFLLTENHLEAGSLVTRAIDETILSNQIILLRTKQGNDCSALIDEISGNEGIQVIKYSMGSKDSSRIAKQLMLENKDVKKWVVIENIEMSSAFLKTAATIIGTIISSSANGNKIILTTQLDTDIPSPLLQSCTQILIENSGGIRAQMFQLFYTGGSPFFIKDFLSIEKKQYRIINFMLAWYYSVIMSRMRYSGTGNGFVRHYEINLNDLRVAERFLKHFLSFAPEITAASLEVIAKFVSGYLFGGKIDVATDVVHLTEGALRLFNLANFKRDRFNILFFSLEETFLSPNHDQDAGYETWLEELPKNDSMVWLGLEDGTEIEFALEKDKKIKAEFQKVTQLAANMK